MSLPVSKSNDDAFDLLARPVQRWIRDKSWTHLRPVQADAITAIIGGDQDTIIAAPTAGGKTEAALLPLLSQIIDSPAAEGGFSLVYIGPLKALITDQALRLEGMLEKTGIPVYPWHGDVSKSRKDKALKYNKGVLLITPESLEAMFVIRGHKVPALFAGTQAIVIDELHTFLDSDRGMQLRSLLSRLDIAVRRRIRRVGLSATLGEMELVRHYVNPEHPGSVRLIADKGKGQELKVQLRGYVQPEAYVKSNLEVHVQQQTQERTKDSANEIEISKHLFKHLRGTRNLVFAGSRENVEAYSDRLSRMCEDAKVPNEFLPHHGNLSRERRSHVEDTLRAGRVPLTAVCTSTLELGIDIGDVECVGQIGAPFSVASLRQRLGRSGRRANDPSVLRMYIDMDRLTPSSHPIGRLRLELVQGIAMIDLLIEGWCEPPIPGALNLSTLTHQVLSIIAERGGASAQRLYKTLCEKGPFHNVDQALFATLLRTIAQPEVSLIEQSADGSLLLGKTGERIANHYAFYAVFKTPDEYRLLADGREIGTLSVESLLVPDMNIVFAGRRWRVLEVDTTAKVILLQHSGKGVPPAFGGSGGTIHHAVRQRMRTVLEAGTVPRYLDAVAGEALAEARVEYDRLRFRGGGMVDIADKQTLLNVWSGTAQTQMLTLGLLSLQIEVELDGAIIEVPCGIDELRTRHLPNLRDNGFTVSPTLTEKLIFDKFHNYLTPELLIKDAFSARIDQSSLRATIDQLLA